MPVQTYAVSYLKQKTKQRLTFLLCFFLNAIEKSKCVWLLYRGRKSSIRQSVQEFIWAAMLDRSVLAYPITIVKRCEFKQIYSKKSLTPPHSFLAFMSRVALLKIPAIYKAETRPKQFFHDTLRTSFLPFFLSHSSRSSRPRG